MVQRDGDASLSGSIRKCSRSGTVPVGLRQSDQGCLSSTTRLQSAVPVSTLVCCCVSIRLSARKKPQSRLVDMCCDEIVNSAFEPGFGAWFGVVPRPENFARRAAEPHDEGKTICFVEFRMNFQEGIGERRIFNSVKAL